MLRAIPSQRFDEPVIFYIGAEGGQADLLRREGDRRRPEGRACVVDHADRLDGRGQTFEPRPEPERAIETQGAFKERDGAAMRFEIETSDAKRLEAGIGQSDGRREGRRRRSPRQ